MAACAVIIAITTPVHRAPSPRPQPHSQRPRPRGEEISDGQLSDVEEGREKGNSRDWLGKGVQEDGTKTEEGDVNIRSNKAMDMVHPRQR